ncbi:hypothetical protein D0863_11379 [Hortaea werneckii]|uniref:TM7S3/TM198-like domain-containing protein n=1 Tax=Hortaea werneckii TaxID=91943 RepID=A0A3M7DB17_HORWE|nr:hypothetical protein D0863_11379 [Hortaea werneckii]
MQLRSVLLTTIYGLSYAGNVFGDRLLYERQDSSNALTTSADDADKQSTTSLSDLSTSTGPSTTPQITSGNARTATTSAFESEHLSSSASKTVPPETLQTETRSQIAITSSPTSGDLPTSHQAKLPLQPKITPAIGISGVILLVSGVALCLIGIKHRWLYVFLSTGLLASLGVTILILYVMNPPVSDAIQGAYMVAAVITGFIFGALALIFKEVTEGLGCLLGGFCLAMWLLVLSPGGLVTSTSGLPIFIVAFCLAAFALSFSHYTRNYGLIFCTSFAGAQVAILGIDCFSRAGLKEFWIYIWDLNDGEFPINTNTYTITRGIKVESACTFILFVFGVLSQLKIWKIVRERRAKKVAEKTREDENRNELEEAVGREIETNNVRDRARWEAVYGDKDQTRVHVDSALGSSIRESDPKHSTSVRERKVEVAGASETVSNRTSKQKEKPLVTVEPASEDGMSERSSTPSRHHLSEETRTSPPGSQRSTMQLDVQDSETQDPHQASSMSDCSQDQGIDPGPGVTPLPFSIPGQESEVVMPFSEKGSEASKRASYSSEQTTGVPLTHCALQTVAELGSRVSAVDDDNASSVAATADDDTDAGMPSPKSLSNVTSPKPTRKGNKITESSGAGEAVEPKFRHSVRRSFIKIPVEEDDDEAVVRPAAVLDDPQPVDKGMVEPEVRTSLPAHWQTPEEQTAFDNSQATGLASLSDHLPPELSKVAMTYRTNEWAKHITEADTPDADAPSRSSSPGIQVDYEEPAKVDVDALRPEPEKPVRSSSQRPTPTLYRQSSQTTSTSETPLNTTRSSSAMQLSRQKSSISTKSPSPNMTHGFRNSSTPLSALPLHEAPGEDVQASAGSRSFSTPMKMANVNNLMDVRNERMVRKPTSMSFNRVSSTPDIKVNDPSEIDTGRTSRLEVQANAKTSPSASGPEEEMTLAERKAMMQQQQQLAPRRDPSRASVRQDTWPKQSHSSMIANPNIIYDSHQPKRNNTVDSRRQSNILAQWRESLQQDAASRNPLRGDEQAHLAMVNERRQTQIHNQAQEARREKRQSAMDIAMRSGQLNNAHRDRLRKMQAQANKRTPQ